MKYSEVAGSPFGLSPTWQRVASVAASDGVIVSDTSSGPAAFDLFWVTVPRNSAPPAVTDKGSPVGRTYDFPRGAPEGDLYLRSDASGTATVVIGST